jgi:hypothetical protein
VSRLRRSKTYCRRRHRACGEAYYRDAGQILAPGFTQLQFEALLTAAEHLTERSRVPADPCKISAVMIRFKEP